MKRKVTLGIAAAALAMSTVTPAALAEETTTFDKVVNADSSLNKKTPAKKDPKEQAELTGKRLENAKKGVDTAKGIVDTLNGLGGLFGFNKGK